MGDFDQDTRVTADAGRQRATLSEDWRIWGPNGGYLAAIALRAVGHHARIPRPASFHGHFLAVGRFDAVDLEVEPVRIGRRSESLRVRMLQDGKPLLEALVRTAAEVPGLEHDVAMMPDVPPPDGLRNVEELRREFALEDLPRHRFWDNLEGRPLEPERFRMPPEPRPPVWREWYRFRPRATFDDPWLDAARSLLLIDTLTWPAAVQPHAPDPRYTAPNLDVTAWFHRSAPEEAWLLADHASPVAEAGLMGTTARVWAASGALLATGGAQLFCVPA
jgi:acyl-CoA thioesterase-2